MSTKIQKTQTHDRLAVVATFPNGDRRTWSVSRSGERLAIKQPQSNPSVTQADFKAIHQGTKHLPDETNGQRLERLAGVFQRFDSIQGLAKADFNPATSQASAEDETPAPGM